VLKASPLGEKDFTGLEGRHSPEREIWDKESNKEINERRGEGDSMYPKKQGEIEKGGKSFPAKRLS